MLTEMDVSDIKHNPRTCCRQFH